MPANYYDSDHLHMVAARMFRGQSVTGAQPFTAVEINSAKQAIDAVYRVLNNTSAAQHQKSTASVSDRAGLRKENIKKLVQAIEQEPFFSRLAPATKEKVKQAFIDAAFELGRDDTCFMTREWKSTVKQAYKGSYKTPFEIVLFGLCGKVQFQVAVSGPTGPQNGNETDGEADLERGGSQPRQFDNFFEFFHWLMRREGARAAGPVLPVNGEHEDTTSSVYDDEHSLFLDDDDGEFNLDELYAEIARLREICYQQEQEIGELRLRLKATETELDKAREAVSLRQAHITQLTETYRRERSILEQRIAQGSGAQQELDSLTQRYEIEILHVKRELEGSQKLVIQLEQQLELVRHDFSISLQQNQQMMQRIEQLLLDKAELSATLHEAMRDNDDLQRRFTQVSSDLEKATDKAQQATAALEQIKGELSDKTRELHNVTEENRAQELSIRRLSAQILDLEQQVDHYKAHVQVLERQVAEQDVDVTRLSRQLTGTTEDLKAAEAKVSQQKLAIVNLEADYQQRLSELEQKASRSTATYESQVIALKQAHADELLEARNILQASEQGARLLAQELESVQQRLESAQLENVLLRQDLKGFESVKSELLVRVRDNQDLQRRLEQTSTGLDRATDKAQQTSAALEQVKDELSDKTRELRNVYQENAEQRVKVDGLLARVSRLEEEVDRKSAAVKELGAELFLRAGQCTALEDRLKATQLDLEQAQAQLRQRTNEIDQLLSTHRAERVELESQHFASERERQKELDVLSRRHQAEMSDVRSELESRERQVSVLAQDLKRVHRQLDSMTEERDSLHRQLHGLTEEKEVLTRRLNNASEENAALHTRLRGVSVELEEVTLRFRDVSMRTEHASEQVEAQQQALSTLRTENAAQQSRQAELEHRVNELELQLSQGAQHKLQELEKLIGEARNLLDPESVPTPADIASCLRLGNAYINMWHMEGPHQIQEERAFNVIAQQWQAIAGAIQQMQMQMKLDMAGARAGAQPQPPHFVRRPRDMSDAANDGFIPSAGGVLAGSDSSSHRTAANGTSRRGGFFGDRKEAGVQTSVTGTLTGSGASIAIFAYSQDESVPDYKAAPTKAPYPCHKVSDTEANYQRLTSDVGLVVQSPAKMRYSMSVPRGGDASKTIRATLAKSQSVKQIGETDNQHYERIAVTVINMIDNVMANSRVVTVKTKDPTAYAIAKQYISYLENECELKGKFEPTVILQGEKPNQADSQKVELAVTKCLGEDGNVMQTLSEMKASQPQWQEKLAAVKDASAELSGPRLAGGN